MFLKIKIDRYSYLNLLPIASTMPSRTDSSAAVSPATFTKPVKPLSSFVRLSSRVSFYDPATSPGVSATLANLPPPPTTILLCGWLNASSKHIAYYANNYMKLYPDARIIVIAISTNEFMFQSEKKRRSDIRSAVDTILARDQDQERLLVHSFSNGGAKRAYGVSGLYRSLTGKPFAPKAMIYDSAPGIPKFKRDWHALMVPAKKMNWLVWLPYTASILAIISVVYVCTHVSLFSYFAISILCRHRKMRSREHCTNFSQWLPKWVWNDLVWAPTIGANDKTLMSQKGVRAYLYSKADLAISWEDVEAHAKDAESKGYTVMRERFEDASHVQLFKGNEERYWGMVEKIWATGMGLSG